MRKLFLVVSLLMPALWVSSHDFDAVSPSGHTLYYDVVPGGAMVVGWDYSFDETTPVRLVIPAHVSNGNVNLRVVAIGSSAFKNAYSLVSVEFPSSVKTIDSSAFEQCYGLGSVAVPSTVESIGTGAFGRVPNVEYDGPAQGAPWGAYYVNAYHEEHYYYADSQKTHLVCCERDASDATLPSTVNEIGDHAFAYCSNITSVSVDNNVTSMGTGVFLCCESLVNAFYNVRTSGSHTFAECKNLRQLTLGSSVRSIPLRFCSGCSSLENIVIPDGVDRLESDAFSGCASLKVAVVGSGVSEIGSNAFAHCISLGEVALTGNITRIGTKAFRCCRSLRELVLPATVVDIDNRAFSGCESINRIVCMADDAPYASATCFDSIDTEIEVVVPCGKEGLYGQDVFWSYFSNFVGQQYYMDVSSNNPGWGSAAVSQQPTCDDNLAVIEAVAADGCRFVRWDDGNTDNPRQIAHTGGGILRHVAMFESDLSVGGTEALPVVSVYVSNGDIVVEGAQGEMVWLFDMMGREWFSAKASSPSFTVPSRHIPTAGVYLIKVGSCKARKIVMP